jgi:hypothetical protein
LLVIFSSRKDLDQGMPFLFENLKGVNKNNYVDNRWENDNLGKVVHTYSVERGWRAERTSTQQPNIGKSGEKFER